VPEYAESYYETDVNKEIFTVTVQVLMLMELFFRNKPDLFDRIYF